MNKIDLIIFKINLHEKYLFPVDSIILSKIIFEEKSNWEYKNQEEIELIRKLY
jgi:hypothetical protein